MKHIGGVHSLAVIGWMLLAFAILSISCKKNGPENPYENLPPVVQNDNPEPDQFPTGSFAWLHAKVFKPTCANSGCHDGTFEPEFRSISSAYNSLVYHPVISNDEALSFTYRVVPGNAAASLLHERLTVDIPNTSGIMPATSNPGADWEANSDMYIQKITDWINDGAKDMFGNPAPSEDANYPPLVYGLAMFPPGNTTTPYPREENSPFGIGSIEIPAANVDVWILPYDDNALFTGFASVALKASQSPTDFQVFTQANCSVQSPIQALDFGNGVSQFYYKATLNFAAASPGDVFFIRAYMDDGVQPSITEIPNDNSVYVYYLIFSVKIV